MVKSDGCYKFIQQKFINMIIILWTISCYFRVYSEAMKALTKQNKYRPALRTHLFAVPAAIRAITTTITSTTTTESEDNYKVVTMAITTPLVEDTKDLVGELVEAAEEKNIVLPPSSHASEENFNQGVKNKNVVNGHEPANKG